MRLFAIFAFTFVVVYGSADLLTSLHSWRYSMGPTQWPFWPHWAAVYLSLDLLLPLAFAKTGKERSAPLAGALLWATLVAWPFFVLFPLQAIPTPSGHLSAAYLVADQLNLSANFFPSLHVAYALICAKWLGRPWVWLWSAAIALATLVTHQHYTIDVLGGAVLAGFACRWAARSIEPWLLEEVVRCAARHRRYALIGFGLLLASLLTGWRRRRLARVGFCYLQHLDDLLDGHLQSQQEPEEIATAHQQALLGRQTFGEDRVGRLGLAFSQQLELHSPEARQWAVAVIEEMKLDRRRVRDGILLEEAELDQHLHRTFELSLDLMLLAADSPLRSHQLPHLVAALGWCSVVRDWDEDQALGLVNVPAPVWRSGTTRQWLVQRHDQVQGQLEKARQELAAVKRVPGHRLLATFLRSVEGYARREGDAARSRNIPA